MHRATTRCATFRPVRELEVRRIGYEVAEARSSYAAARR